jgi:hypothetical protein
MQKVSHLTLQSPSSRNERLWQLPTLGAYLVCFQLQATTFSIMRLIFNSHINLLQLTNGFKHKRNKNISALLQA